MAWCARGGDRCDACPPVIFKRGIHAANGPRASNSFRGAREMAPQRAAVAGTITVIRNLWTASLRRRRLKLGAVHLAAGFQPCQDYFRSAHSQDYPEFETNWV
jgi:hypothetical protein